MHVATTPAYSQSTQQQQGEAAVDQLNYLYSPPNLDYSLIMNHYGSPFQSNNNFSKVFVYITKQIDQFVFLMCFV